MKQLKARLYEAELQKREAEADAANAAKTDIGWGHQIRSYVLQPYQLVKDLRTGVTSTAPSRRARRRSRPVHGRGLVAARHRREGRGRGCRVERCGSRYCVAAAPRRLPRRAAAAQSDFPAAGRDVAPIVGDSFSTEDARDRVGEAEAVIAFAGVAPGMTVADIGAGEGYYTVRLSPLVGPRGRVLAQDIVPATRDRLALRVEREGLDNVAVRLGLPDDPQAAAGRASTGSSWSTCITRSTGPMSSCGICAQGLKPGGLVVVVDANRPVKRHGMPPRELACEFAAIGLQQMQTQRLAGSDAYYVAFGSQVHDRVRKQ